MTKKFKWLTLALLAGSATLFNGCLGAFWDGLWNTGWPTQSRWLNLAIDILNEEIFS
jgi:hypothetical protein